MNFWISLSNRNPMFLKPGFNSYPSFSHFFLNIEIIIPISNLQRFSFFPINRRKRSSVLFYFFVPQIFPINSFPVVLHTPHLFSSQKISTSYFYWLQSRIYSEIHSHVRIKENKYLFIATLKFV